MKEIIRLVNLILQSRAWRYQSRLAFVFSTAAILAMSGIDQDAPGQERREESGRSEATWSQWRGSSRDGQSYQGVPLIQELPEEGLAPVWMSEEKIQSGNQGGWSSPIVDDRNVYLYVHTKRRTEEGIRYFESLYAWDRDTGDNVWTRENETTAVRFPLSGTPLVRENRLYYLAGERKVICRDASNGELIWQRQLPGEITDTPFHSSIVWVQNKVVVYLDRLYACDASTGELQWMHGEANSKEGSSSPIVWNHDDRELLIYIDSAGRANGINPSNGEAVWQVDAHGGAATPLCKDDVLITYGRSRRGGVAAYRIHDNDVVELWRNQEFADSGASPVVVGDAVYVEGERDLACLDLETGVTRWSTRLDMPRPRYTSLIAADNTLFYAFDGLLAFAPNTDRFELRFEAKISRDGHLATQEHFRGLYEIDDLEQSPEGEREAESIWRREIEQGGPVPCCTPIIDDGFLFIRLRDRVAVFNLRRHSGETEPQAADDR